MAFKGVKRPANRAEISVYSQPGGFKKTAVCKFFQQSKCNRGTACWYSHILPTAPLTDPTREQDVTSRDNVQTFIRKSTAARSMATQKSLQSLANKQSVAIKNIITCGSMSSQKSMSSPKSMPSQQSLANKQRIPAKNTMDTQNTTQQIILAEKSIGTQKNNVVLKPVEKVCNFWATGKCMKGDTCPCLHSWFRGDGFSMLATLQDHEKMVTGIVLPEGSSKLYSASKDKTVRVWDCHTGRCTSVINLGGEAGCLYSKGPWVFAGSPNVVEAWNIQTNAKFSLSAPAGQVHSMDVGNEMLFAGTQEGVILVWEDGLKDNPFQLAAPLEGHIGAVVCLKVDSGRLYSGSADHTIRVWDLNTLQSIMTLNAHSDAVTSLICWGQSLISCSLDCTIKVWAEKDGNLEATYTHTQEHGLTGLCGMADAEAKPVLLCSCKDNSVWLYELPSFAERGRLFAKEEVGAIQVGPGGLFFSGDGTGLLSVWKWLEPGLKVQSS